MSQLQLTLLTITSFNQKSGKNLIVDYISECKNGLLSKFLFVVKHFNEIPDKNIGLSSEYLTTIITKTYAKRLLYKYFDEKRAK